ncbi:MAG TPA: hypothetical protein VGW12_21015 [Pyrinomonadaceae bacterium]|nr:hypothetical protein [Pyrinomonadaceae bacterium]
MKNRVARRCVLKRVVRRGVAAAFIIAALSVAVVAQQQRGERQDSPPARSAQSTSNTTGASSNADEDFELNITERRITERDFFASTAIEAGESAARGLSLRVGVAVGASEIDVLLRNVQGRVRFRGSLEILQRMLDARRTADGAAPRSP